MDKEQTRAAAAVMVAHADGKRIDYQRRDSLLPGQWSYASTPVWDFTTFNYRIAPEPKRRALRMSDLEGHPVVWLRTCKKIESLVTQIDTGGFSYTGFRGTFESLAESSIYEYSFDRTNWQGCFKIEEAE